MSPWQYKLSNNNGYYDSSNQTKNIKELIEISPTPKLPSLYRNSAN